MDFYQRQYLPRNKSDGGDDRTSSQHDRDVVLYSSAFKRLLSVTQVASGSTGTLLHTRLTHSLQVAQVGRRLAEKLLKRQPELAQSNGIDPDAVETACLAHDMGHPPFGHLAEEVLDEKSSDFGGFEGNAQSFRIVTRLGICTDGQPGLNLTRKSLRCLLKYPWTYSNRPKDTNHASGRKPKWGAYDCDADAFDWVWKGSDGGPLFTRDAGAEIMDWADDITYSVHDVEDFFRAGLIPLHLLKPKGAERERERFLRYVLLNASGPLANKSVEELSKVLDDIFLIAGSFEQPYEGTRDDHAKLRTFTSRLIGIYINALELSDAHAQRVVRAPTAETEIALLKELTWFYVIEATGLALQHRAQRKIIETLCDVFLETATEIEKRTILPPLYRDALKQSSLTEEAKKRVIIDLIAGMTEGQAIAVYQRIEGITTSANLDRILV